MHIGCDDCVNGCRRITNSYNNPHHNTIIAPNVHTLQIHDKDELTHALTQSLIELDKIGLRKHETFQKLPSAPTSEVDMKCFVAQAQRERDNSPVAQRLRKKMHKPDPGSNPLFEYRK